MPGLLQTAEYATAVVRARPNTREEDIEELVAARLARQAVLEREDPPIVWVLLDEGVLHRPAAPPGVMYRQLMHLADVRGPAQGRVAGHDRERGGGAAAAARARRARSEAFPPGVGDEAGPGRVSERAARGPAGRRRPVPARRRASGVRAVGVRLAPDVSLLFRPYISLPGLPARRLWPGAGPDTALPARLALNMPATLASELRAEVILRHPRGLIWLRPRSAGTNRGGKRLYA